MVGDQKAPERVLALMKASKLVPLSSLRIILKHHGAPDGTGYPRGLTGNKISKLSFVFGIVDKFDT